MRQRRIPNRARSCSPASPRIVSDFPGSATVSVAAVGVSPTASSLFHINHIDYLPAGRGGVMRG